MDEINGLVKKAEEDIRAAELLIKEEICRIAVSRAYYAKEIRLQEIRLLLLFGFLEDEKCRRNC